MKTLFFEFLPYSSKPRFWHGHAYYALEQDRRLTVIYPLHYLVRLAWWINLKWAQHANAPSWIDRRVSKEVEAELKRRGLL